MDRNVDNLFATPLKQWKISGHRKYDLGDAVPINMENQEHLDLEVF